MRKTAFLFPGQGAQYVEMGKDFYYAYSISRQTFEEASENLGIDISNICFNGPDEDLLKTENTQPAILTTSIAILRAIQKEGFSCDYTAGLSLGEYSALVNAEAIEFSDAVRVVRNRGIYMQQAVPYGLGKMGAIVGLDRDKIMELIEETRKDGLIEVANYNTPEQVVLSGEAKAIKNAVRKAKQWGAKKALLLPVSAPFHCSLLKPAAEMLQVDLESINYKDPKIPLINN
ncbi:MAG: ACP S-malonyltransferase, partial [Thermoanaerobacteraceae bacterium]|nr:ACP S-malonyltransferase [Thermoanaerobacteraceae bacterium]